MNTELETTQAPEKETTTHSWERPLYDVSENKEAFSVKVSLPGVNRDGVDISLEDDTLAVTATRTTKVPEGWRPLRREISRGDYRLNLRLNVPINEDKIVAHVEDGVLDLSIPKADQVKPRKIQIS